MKKNNLILAAFLTITVILFSSCGASSSSDSTESTEPGGVVTIGTQVWTSKNLNVETYRNGDSIPEAKTKGEWLAYAQAGEAAWCYYDNDPSIIDFFNGTCIGQELPYYWFWDLDFLQFCLYLA